MKRKVVRHGPSSLTISLPNEWVKKFNIKKGDELSVKELGKELKIYPEEIKNKEEKKDISIGVNEKTGKSVITGAYRQGYDHLELSFTNPEYIKSIQNVMFQQVMGFEIVRQTENKCEIKDLTGHVKDEFDAVQRRIWLLLLDFAEESAKALEKNDKDWMERIKSRDYTINRFANYCLRHLIKQGHSNPNNTPVHYYAIKCLEEIADGYKNTCSSIKERTTKLNKEEIEIIKSINKILNKVYSIWYKHDRDEIENTFKDIKSINEKISSKETPLSQMLNVTSRISNLLSVIIQLNI